MDHGTDPLNGFSERNLALVIVDAQNKFARPGSAVMESLSKRLGRINEAAGAFRRAGRPVILVKFDGEGHGGGRGEDPDGIVPGLEVADSDIVVHKSFMNSFRESGLEDAIKSRGCDGVVFAGIVAQYCVISTYFAAFDRGLVPYILRGGIASNIESKAEAVETVCKCVGMDEIMGNVGFRRRMNPRDAR